MVQNIVIGVIGVGSILAYSIYIAVNEKQKKPGLYKKYNILIALLLAKNTKCVIKKEFKDSLTLSISQEGKKAFVYIVQAHGILAIEIEFISQTIDHTIEWYFPKNHDQYKIYEQMYHDISQYLDKNRSVNESVISFSNFKKISKTTSSNQTLSYISINASELFCIAWQSTLSLDHYRSLSKESKFEVLCLNIFMALDVFWDTLNISYYDIEDESIHLLVFYLNKHNLIANIRSFNNFIHTRIEFYREEINKVNHHNQFDLGKLHYYFYDNPLSQKAPDHLPIPESSFYDAIQIMLHTVKTNSKEYLKSCGIPFIG